MPLEDLRAGADVISRDGHKLGTLSRVVVNKDTLKISHIVVDTGRFRSGKSLLKGAWSFPRDRVIPLAALTGATSEEIQVSMSAEEFKDLSVDYDVTSFEPLPDVKPGRIDTSDVARIATSIPGEPGPFFIRDTLAKAPDEVDITKDSPVWRLKPHEKIGEVERVLFDEETQKVSGLVVRRGFVFSRDVVLPVRYIVEVVEAIGGIVRVDMSDDDVDGLEEYHPAD